MAEAIGKQIVLAAVQKYLVARRKEPDAQEPVVVHRGLQLEADSGVHCRLILR